MQHVSHKLDVKYNNKLIDEFVEIYGKNVLDDIYHKLIKYNILEKFSDAFKNINKLFKFSIHHGLLEIVQFLYEHKGVKFNNDILYTYHPNFNTNINKNAQTSESGSSSNTSLNVTIWDNFTTDRQKCIKYLIFIKAYSKYTYENKKFIYYYSVKKL